MPIYENDSSTPLFIDRKEYKELYRLNVSRDFIAFLENAITTSQIQKIIAYKHGHRVDHCFIKRANGRLYKEY